MLTINPVFAIISLALTERKAVQRYRSGHNEAVLKTVCPRGRVGSNPTLCVGTLSSTMIVVQLILEKYPRG